MKCLVAIAIATTLIFSAGVQAKPTKAGQEMYNKLTRLSNILSVDKRVKIIVKDVGGSYTDGTGTIYIDTGDIKFCKRNMDCIASIAAHELGHNVLGHVRGNDYPDKQQEKDSDLYAVKLLNAAGYNPCAGADFFREVGKEYGDEGGPQHPNNSVRVNYITQACTGNIAAPPQPWTKAKSKTKNGKHTTIHKTKVK